MAETEKKKEGKDAVILATPASEAEAQRTIKALKTIKPDLNVKRVTVCYELDGKCVCPMVKSDLLSNHVAALFRDGKIRVLQGRGGPPVDAKLYELIKETFIARGKAK